MLSTRLPTKHKNEVGRSCDNATIKHSTRAQCGVASTPKYLPRQPFRNQETHRRQLLGCYYSAQLQIYLSRVEVVAKVVRAGCDTSSHCPVEITSSARAFRSTVARLSRATSPPSVRRLKLFCAGVVFSPSPGKSLISYILASAGNAFYNFIAVTRKQYARHA